MTAWWLIAAVLMPNNTCAWACRWVWGDLSVRWLCCWPRAKETVWTTSPVPCPLLLSAASLGQLVGCWLLFRGLDSLDWFISRSNSHGTSQTLRKRERKGGNSWYSYSRLCWDVCVLRAQWEFRDRAEPQSLDLGPEPCNRSAHCLGHKRVLEGSWDSVWHEALSHPVRWRLGSICPVRTLVVEVWGRWLVRCPLRWKMTRLINDISLKLV